MFDELRRTKEGANELVKATEGLIRVLDFLFNHPKYIFWTALVIGVIGAIIGAKDTWLLLVGIGLFLWGFSLRRAEVRNR